MKRKIPTRPSLLRRIVRNEIGFVLCLILGCVFLLMAGEALCSLVGAGYDPRIGVPA